MDYTNQLNAPQMIVQPQYEPLSPALIGFFIGEAIFITIVSIVLIIAMWKIFVKAGKPGWAAIIPIYNVYIMLKMVDKPGWWVLLYFVPIANIIIPIIVALELAKRFGRSEAFGILLLYVFQPIGIMMLGFGKSKYVGATKPETSSDQSKQPKTTK